MEYQISSAITKGWFHKLQEHLKNDVIIVGGGPSGLLCASELAQANLKTCLIESKLAPGGGMWGGAMLFNTIVIQSEALFILEKYGISYLECGDGLYTVDAVEATSSLIYHASHAGVAIFNGVCMEDVVVKENYVSGVVINWNPVQRLGMHVDPLSLTSQVVLDATGHPSEVVGVLTRKNPVELLYPEMGNRSERSMNAEAGERACVQFTGRIYPGLYICGMAACGVSGSNRMGPIFGGMLLSGMKAARLITAELAGGK